MIIKAKNLKLLINEATFTSIKNVIKKGDVLSVIKNNKTFNYTITDIKQLPSGLHYSLRYVVKSTGVEYNILFNPIDYNNNTLTMNLIKPNNVNQKYTITDVSLINVIRNGKIIEVIDGKVDNVKDDSEKNKDSEAEELIAFNDELSKAKPGDLFTVSTGVVDKNGNIKRNTITDLNFNVESVADNKVYLTVNSIKGKDSARYSGLENWEDVTLNDDSYKFNAKGSTVIFHLFGGGKTEVYSIDGIFSYELQSGAGEIKKDVEPEESDEEILRREKMIMNNPYLKKALIGKPSLLKKLFGISDEKAFTSILNRIKDSGLDNAFINKKEKVKITLLSGDIQGTNITLRSGKGYEAYSTQAHTFKLTSKNPNEVCLIDVISKTGGDNEYNAEIIFQKIFNKKVLSEKKYNAKISITKIR